MKVPASHEAIRALTADENTLMAAWRSLAIGKLPYFVSLILKLSPMHAPTGSMQLSHDGRLLVDMEAMARDHTPDKVAQYLLHLVSHLYREDARRAVRAGADQSAHRQYLWNIAVDMVINDDLVSSNVMTADEFDYLPSTFNFESGKTAEQYYRALIDKFGDTPSDPGLDDETDGGTPTEPSGCGSCATASDALEIASSDALDVHGQSLDSLELDAARLNCSRDILRASEHHGDVPEGLVTTAKLHLSPSRIPWQKILHSRLSGAIARRSGDDEVDVLRPRRMRGTVHLPSGRRLFVPDTYSTAPSILAIRDTSGSMGNTNDDSPLMVVSNEIVAIARRILASGGTLRFMDVDADTYTVHEYRRPNDLETVIGGGGTDMAAGIVHASALNVKPDVIVVLTDGYTPWPERPVGIPVIAAIVVAHHGASEQLDVPSWIRVIECVIE